MILSRERHTPCRWAKPTVFVFAGDLVPLKLPSNGLLRETSRQESSLIRQPEAVIGALRTLRSSPRIDVQVRSACSFRGARGYVRSAASLGACWADEGAGHAARSENVSGESPPHPQVLARSLWLLTDADWTPPSAGEDSPAMNRFGSLRLITDCEFH